MKFKKKARGLMIIEVIVGVALVGSAIPTGAHLYAQRRAEDRLDTIMSNLAGIDAAIAQWDKTQSGVPVRANLDGTNGTMSYVKWPVGPVSGEYSISTSSNLDAVPAGATFDGGGKGAMTRPEWQKACGADPSACGL